MTPQHPDKSQRAREALADMPDIVEIECDHPKLHVYLGKYHETIREALTMMGDEGMVWVPREPTEAMAQAECDVCPANFETRYKAMINAAKEGE